MIGGLDPNVVAIGLFVVGYFLASRDRGGDQRTKSVQVDTELRQQILTLQAWQRDHSTIHQCVTRLATLMEGHTRQMAAMGRDIHELTRDLRMQMPVSPRRYRERNPYEFDGKDWIEPEGQQ